MGKNSKALLAIAAIVALATAGNALYQRYDSHQRDLSRASALWPSVSGLITHSGLEARRSNTRSDKSTDFVVEVTYEYVVDNQLYRNDVVRFDQASLPNDRKELLVGAYPVGKRVDVFYNPDNPDQSVLVRGSYKEDSE